ncbi:MAG: class I SAM-dependent methyltransferase [Bacteroidota bacterium]
MSHLPYVETLPLENRLRKNFKHFRRWARRRGLEAYRVYDADLDEFPFTVDFYGDQLYVAIYADRGPAGWRAIPEPIREEGLSEIFQAVLGVGPAEVQIKKRQKQRGEQQYEKLSEDKQFFAVAEQGLQFWVNLTDYLDTGLFLDHRNTRAMVREAAAGKSVLNLFAYTGSFTVYAAAGGARTTHTLDLSTTYLEWGQRNLALNDLAGPQHRFEKVDVLAWLQQPIQEKYDIIVLDPPTFSNSKAMKEVLDTQRDHVMMINSCIERLASGGELYFSTNNRRFKLEEAALQASSIREISHQTVPDDFRKGGIHRCWKIS